MNERIKELIKQAVSFRLDPDSECYEALIHPEDLELFAELIVRECICQCDDENSQKYIMSHFGFTEKDWS